MFSINSNSMFTEILPCARHDSRLGRSINERKRQNQGKVVRGSQCGELDLRVILVRVFGGEKKELNSLEFFVGWYLIVTY